MSRILRRPMFRKGGAVEKGIGSMMPRKKYATGSEYAERLTKAAGELGDYDPLTKFLLSYGPALATQRPTGGLLGTLTAAAAKPTEQLLLDRAKRAEEARNLRVAGEKAAIEQEGRMELLKKELEGKLDVAKLQAEALNISKVDDAIDNRAKMYKDRYDPDASYRLATYDIKVKPLLVSKVTQSQVEDDPLDFNFNDSAAQKKEINKLVSQGKVGKYFYDIRNDRVVKLYQEPTTGTVLFVEVDPNDPVGSLPKSQVEQMQESQKATTVEQEKIDNRFQYLNPKQEKGLKKIQEKGKEKEYGFQYGGA